MRHKTVHTLFALAAMLLTAGMLAGTAQAAGNGIILTPEERAYAQTAPPIKLCVDPDWYPYEQIDENGIYQGIAADLMQLICQRTGLRMEIVPTKDWEESVHFMQQGRCDVLSLLNQTPERDAWMDFSDPYFTDPNVLITREEHDYISDPSRLTGETVVLPYGTSVEERLKKDYPNLNILTVASEGEALEYVSSRKADFTVRSLTMAAYTIRKEGLFNLKIAGQIPNSDNLLRMGIREGQPILQDILNKGIASLTQDDVNQAINHHIPMKIEQGFDYKLFFIILGVFLFFCLAGILWINQLHRLTKKLETQKRQLDTVHNQLAESEALYRSFLTASPDAVVISTAEGTILMASPAAYALVGIDPERDGLVGHQLYEFVAPGSVPKMRSNVEHLLRTGQTQANVYGGVRCDGQGFIMEVKSEAIRDTGDSPTQLISIVRDITEQRRIEEALQTSERNLRQLARELKQQNTLLYQSASYDKLTGTHNRAFLESIIQDELERQSLPGVKRLSLVLFDLDNFKSVNDTYGHATGDVVLTQIASTVRNSIRRDDVLARWGGEEFAVFLRDTSAENACAVAEKMRSAVEQIDHPMVGKVTISIGVAQYQAGEKANEWFQRADAAMYCAKKLGRNRISCG